jgi:carboxyl-terminal processing protease
MVTRPVLLVAGALLGACATRPSAPPYDPALGIQSFDAAWRIVHETHFDTTFNGVDWPGVRDELRPRALAARSNDEIRMTITQMIGRLGQSHFAVIPRDLAEERDSAQERASRAAVGLELRLVEGHIVVTRVRPGSAGDRAGVRPGWSVQRVDGRSVDSIVQAVSARPGRYSVKVRAWSAVAGRLVGTAGSSVSVAFLDGDDRELDLALLREAEPGEYVKFGNMPAFLAMFDSRSVTGPGGARVAVLTFNNWMSPLMRRLDAAVDSARSGDGFVLDLRGNGGGMGPMTGGVAGHFIPRRDTLGTMLTRAGRLVFTVNPRLVTPDGRTVQPFAGPVAVLVDRLSGSASEVFAGGMQALGRMRVFGDTSLGGVLPAMTDRLPNGDVLYHAIGDFRTRDGTLMEGRGAIPDEVVQPIRADYLAGRDPVLEAALRWIETNRTGGPR